MARVDKVATETATALLLSEGELPVSEVEELPGVRDRAMALAVINELSESYDTYIEKRPVDVGGGVRGWDYVLVLQPDRGEEAAGLGKRRAAVGGLTNGDLREVLARKRARRRLRETAP